MLIIEIMHIGQKLVFLLWFGCIITKYSKWTQSSRNQPAVVIQPKRICILHQ